MYYYYRVAYLLTVISDWARKQRDSESHLILNKE